MAEEQPADEGVSDDTGVLASRVAQLATSVARGEPEGNGHRPAVERLEAALEQQLWNIVTAGTAVVAGLAARSIITSVWRRAAGDEPPRNPAAPDIGWSSALAWAALSGVAIGVARTLARRGVAEAWRRTRGELPDASDDLGLEAADG